MACRYTMTLLPFLLLTISTLLTASVLKDTRSLSNLQESTGIIKQETAEENQIEMAAQSTEEEIESNFNFDADEENERYSERLYVSDSTELNNPMVNHQKYTFLMNSKDGCPENVFVLALIKSSPHKFMERQDIRKTWGSVKEYKGLKIVPLFIIGKYFLANSSDIENELLGESAKYGDIIQGDFVDHYKNQTYKTLMGLTWAKTNCNQAKYVLNTNDDTMVDIYHLVDFLQDPKADEENFLYCSTFYDQGPNRNPVDKNYITLNEYPYDKFPPHCEGFGNVMSKDVADNILDAAKLVPYLWLDDVFTTGFLALKADVKHCDMRDGHSYKFMQKSQIEAGVQDTMFWIAKYRRLRNNWDTAWKAIQTSNQK